MPIIQFTESDKLAAITADAGFYQSVVTEMETKASSSGNSNNTWTTFQITQEGKFKGKEIKCCFCSGVDNASLLGGVLFRPQSDILVLAAAINKTTLEEVPLDLNTDDLMLKGFDLQVLVDVADGVPVNKPGVFVPFGKATSAEAQKVAF